jgi:hypothetical protein
MARNASLAARLRRDTFDRRSTQLFSQETLDDSPTQDQTQEELQPQGKEAELQNAFNSETPAIAPTRVAFSDFFTFTDNDDVEGLQNLDEGLDSAKYLRYVTKNPETMYQLLGQLMDLARSSERDRDTLLEANEINKGKYEDLRTKYQSAVQTATELQKLIDSDDNPLHEAARYKEQAEKYRKYAGDYRSQKKQLEDDVIQYKTQISTQTEQIDDLNQQVLDIETLKQEISDLKAAAQAAGGGQRGRTRERRERTSMSRSLSRARRGGTAPSKSRSRVRSPSARLPPCYGRETTAVANASITTHSVTINPNQTKGIDVGRNIPNPSKFGGDSKEFYPFIAGLELKLQEASFKTEVDGMKYVQGFLTGAAWSLVRPRVPTDLGIPCANPYETVHQMLKHLSSRYGTHDHQGKAFSKFATLVQGRDESFSDFYVKYSEVAPYLEMSAENEVLQFKSKLNSRYRNRLVGEKFYTVEELVSRCENLESDFEVNDALNKTSDSNKEKRTTRSGRSYDAESSSGGSTSNRTRRADLPEEFRNLPPLTTDEHRRCEREGLCKRCRQKGHYQKDTDKCPLAQFEKAAKEKKLNNSGTTVTTEGDQPKAGDHA